MKSPVHSGLKHCSPWYQGFVLRAGSADFPQRSVIAFCCDYSVADEWDLRGWGWLPLIGTPSVWCEHQYHVERPCRS